MGCGLYFDPDAITAFAEPFAHIMGTDEDNATAREDALDVFVDEVFECLGAGWTEQDRWRNGHAQVIAESGAFEVALMVDSEGLVHVSMAAQSGLSETCAEKARRALKDEAARFFGRLCGMFPLRVRETAWTSRPFRVEGVAA